MTQPVVIDLPAQPRARGEAHGEHLRPLIAEAIVRWRESLAELDGSHPDDWIGRFLSETDFVPAIEATTPELLEEVRGMAAGAGLAEDEMLAYQLVDEQWCWTTRRPRRSEAEARRTEHEHCSTLGVAASDGAPAIVAQNLDLPLWWDGLQTVLRVPPWRDEPGCIIVTAAGFVVMNGMNDAGVAIGVNALPDVPSAPTGLPVAFAIRHALTRQAAPDAVAALRSVKHASGQNYIIGGGNGVIGVEADAEGTTAYDAVAGCAVHTNHAVVRSALSDPGMVAGGALANSRARLDFLAKHRGAVRTVADAIEVLSDSSVPIRRLPTDESPSGTYATVVFELADVPVVHVRGGLREHDFVHVAPVGVSEVAR